MRSVQREEGAERLRVGREEVAIRLSAVGSGGGLLALDVTMPPGGGPPALHRHEAAEVSRVLEGELALYVAEGDAVERLPASAGAVVHVPGGVEHTIRNESDRPARGFVTFAGGAPAMEAFVRAAASLPADAGPEAAMAFATGHGIEVTRELIR
jgi:quercetin dioxygenase-like cupin family protein